MDFRLKIKRDHESWVQGVKLVMDERKITYQALGDLLGVTSQSAWNKIKGKTPFHAVEKEIINKYFTNEVSKR